MRKTKKLKMTDMIDKDGKIECALCKNKLAYKSGGLTRHLRAIHGIDIKNYYIDNIGGDDSTNCQCGCGEITGWQSRGGYYHDYISGHNYRGKNKKNDESVRRRAKKMIKNENWKKSTFSKGDIPWNVGLTKKISDRVANSAKKGKQTMASRSKETLVIISAKASARAKADFASGKRKSYFSYCTPKQRAEMRQKAIKTMAERGTFPNSRKFKTGRYKSTKSGENLFYGSSYELQRMKQLDSNDDVDSWSRCKDLIQYFSSSAQKMRNYNPDFNVRMKSGSKSVEEIKGFVTQTTIDKAVAASLHYEKLGVYYKILTKRRRENNLVEITIKELQSIKRVIKW